MQRLQCALALLAIAGIAYAQDFRAHIQGTVTDASAAAIAGATVGLLNVDTGVRSSATTNETGAYRFDYVDPGKYTLTVEQTGFSKYSQENFTVQAGGDITVNVPLQVGGMSENVTIAASPVEVQFNNTNVSLTVDTKMAQDLPRFEPTPLSSPCSIRRSSRHAAAR